MLQRQLARQEQAPGLGDMHLETVRTWILWQTEVERRRGAQFARREVRGRAWASLRGLLSPVERKNHTPSNFVVDQEASDAESSLSREILLLDNVGTTFCRLIRDPITSIISIA